MEIDYSGNIVNLDDLPKSNENGSMINALDSYPPFLYHFTIFM